MKTLHIVLFFFLSVPGFVFAQSVSIMALPSGPVSAPAGFQHIASFRIESAESVRVQWCRLSFESDLFAGMSRLYTELDGLPYSSVSAEFLTNPFTDHVTNVVGLGNDSVRVFDYYVDLDSAFAGSATITVSCQINPYTTGAPVFYVSPVAFVHDVESLPVNIYEISSLQNFPSTYTLLDMGGREIGTHESQTTLNLAPGIYILWDKASGYRQKILVR